MEKKLYWQVESNGDLSITCSSLEEVNITIESDFNSLDENEQSEIQYTITPIWLTDNEYNNLPEA